MASGLKNYIDHTHLSPDSPPLMDAATVVLQLPVDILPAPTVHDAGPLSDTFFARHCQLWDANQFGVISLVHTLKLFANGSLTLSSFQPLSQLVSVF